MGMKNQLKSLRKEIAMAYFKVTSPDLSGGTEDNNERSY
jgi:hypothetical protein